MRIFNSSIANENRLKMINGYNSQVMCFRNTTQSNISKCCFLFLFLFTLLGQAEAQDPCNGMKCNSNVNLSLDQTCSAEVTASMLLQEMNFAEAEYIVEVYDHLNNLVDNEFDINDIDKTYEAKVILPACGNNSCWSNVFVEYKLPPQIDCPTDLTISCGGLDILGLPAAVAGCADLAFDVTLHDETKTRLDCDPNYTHIVTRTYRATDVLGNFVECSHTITLERVDLSAIMFPEPRSIATGNAISCSDSLFMFDENGVPLPWLRASKSASGTSGVPFICDPLAITGVFCPITMTGSGSPLIPSGGATTLDDECNVILVEGEADQFCNSAIFYTDVELPYIGCVKKIMRTWEVREWWCSGENERTGLQLIEIVDDEAPTFQCPADFSVTTNDDCAGSVDLPSIVAEDNCGNGILVSIDYPNGFLQTNGGVAELETGVNVVTYIVSDECYNSSTCTMQVTVADNTEPVAICERNTVVSISQSGNTIVYADAFDDGSWDECGLHKFEVRRMDTLCVASNIDFSESVTFCCEDVGNEVMVVFRAYDKGGNKNECMVRVEVQDKVVASMTCPDDEVIDCRVPYDIDNLSLVFGEPTIVDNCPNTQNIRETVTEDVDQCGTGTLIRQFELLDVTGVFVLKECKQLITVRNETPFVPSNITWPIDYSDEGDYCGLEDVSPERLEERSNQSQFPQFSQGDDVCSLLGWDYEDRVVNTGALPGQCVYIERYWTVINWCSPVNGQFEIFDAPFPQIITLHNSEKPEFVSQEDTITIRSINIDCESGRIEVAREATDDCPLDDLSFSYTVSDNETSSVVATGNTSTYVDTLVAGDYTIDWTVRDGCGNLETDQQMLIVINEKAPIPICIQGLSVRLTRESNPTGTDYTAELWASDFDGGSYHNCENEFVLSLSADTDSTNVTYNCDHVGEQDVMLWVTDITTGVQDFCVTQIEVLPPTDGECPDDNVMNRVIVQGDIYTEMFDNIEDVQVTLMGSESSDMTDETGHYEFDNMPMGGSYIVDPKKDGGYLNGVSTLDLVLIQRHILGIEQLDSPYKIIAADIDANDQVSVLDLIELRKLILGIHDEYQSNNSWRFVDADHTFVDPQNPWRNDFPENYEIFNLVEDMNIDFIGVKIGDVNSSVVSNATNTNDGIRKAKSNLEFSLTSQKSNIRGQKELIVTSANYNELIGWQSAFQFDPNQIQIVGFKSGAIKLEDGINLNTRSIENGEIVINHFNSNAQTFDKNEVLFTVTYEDINSEVQSPLAVLNGKFNNEAYDKNYNTLNINSTIEVSEELAIVGAKPNPWTDYSIIEFTIPQRGKVNWQFYDINGRKLYETTEFYNKGKQEMRINSSDINASGVIYIRMTTDYGKAEFKTMVIN